MTVQKLTAAQQRRNQRVSRYQQLVRPLACHYARCCREPIDDLIQVGLLGLLRAAELYSPQSGTPFEAFARPHVRGAILHYLRDVAPMLRLPRRLGERHQQLQRARQQWVHQHGRDPQPRDLRERLGLTAGQWEQLQQAAQLCLVVPLDPGLLEQVGTLPAEPRGASVAAAIQALRQLQPPLREVVRQVVLEGHSYRHVGARLQVSPMTVQRRLQRGLAELRQRLSPGAGSPHPAGSAAAGC